MEAATPAVSSLKISKKWHERLSATLNWRCQVESATAAPFYQLAKPAGKENADHWLRDRKMVHPVTFQIGFSKRPPFKNIENISLGRIHEMFHHVLCTRLHLLCFLKQSQKFDLKKIK